MVLGTEPRVSHTFQGNTTAELNHQPLNYTFYKGKAPLVKDLTSAPGIQLSVVPISGDIMPFSGLHEHQSQIATYAGKHSYV